MAVVKFKVKFSQFWYGEIPYSFASALDPILN